MFSRPSNLKGSLHLHLVNLAHVKGTCIISNALMVRDSWTLPRRCFWWFATAEPFRDGAFNCSLTAEPLRDVAFDGSRQLNPSATVLLTTTSTRTCWSLPRRCFCDVAFGGSRQLNPSATVLLTLRRQLNSSLAWLCFWRFATAEPARDGASNGSLQLTH